MNRQTAHEERNQVFPSGLETGGPDTLKLSFHGEWEQTAFLALSKQLDAAQAEAQTGQGGAGVMETPAGDRWKVSPAGSRQGDGGLYYRWVVEWDGNRICILNRGGHSPHAPNVLVQLGSLALMTRGLEELEAALRGMLADAGFRILSDVPGELHVCCDLAGREVGEFTRLAMTGCEVTKAKKGKLYFGATSDDHETFYRGNGSRVLMRIYDKLAETENDPEKRAFLIARRWGCLPESAVRVEFQIRRDVLKERFSVSSLADLKAKMPEIVRWCVEEWYRLAERPVDRANNNQSRVDVAPIWRSVQAAFVAWVGRSVEPFVVPRKALQAKSEQLIKQAVGCFRSAAALTSRIFTDPDYLMNWVVRQVDATREELFDGVQAMRELLGIKHGPSVEPAGSGCPF